MVSAKLALGAALLVGSDAAYLQANYARAPALRDSLVCMKFGAGAAPRGERIVVTGVGVVTAIGNGDNFWNNLLAGKSGVDTIQGFDVSRFPTKIGAECLDFDSKLWFTNPKNAKATDR